MSNSTPPSKFPLAPARHRVIKGVAGRLITAIGADRERAWTLDRALDVAGSRVSRATCESALSFLVQIGAIVEVEPGVWRAQGLWRGTQADWYT